ncbi:MAG: arginine N-succinyltransferase, partial [Acinetobacter sp.]|nr:arginine N-succinyltransferase [Acinetobacter sp.]
MMIVRHAEHRDLDDIYILAGKSGIGLTSLPQNKEILSARISRTQKNLAGQATTREEGYLFFLEDTLFQRGGGGRGIEGLGGFTEAFYNYHYG